MLFLGGSVPRQTAKHRHGKPCVKCGSTLRYKKSGDCVACNSTPEKKAARRLHSLARGKLPEVRAARKVYDKAYRSGPAVLAAQMVRNARSRAEDKGLDFDLHVTPIEMRVRIGFCEATGLAFDFTPHAGNTNNRPFAPCIDRVDSSGGYVWSNIRVVCNIYNHAKHDYSETEVLTLARALVARNFAEPQ